MITSIWQFDIIKDLQTLTSWHLFIIFVLSIAANQV